MTIQNTPTILVPGLDSIVTTLSASLTIAASGSKVGAVFHAPKSGVIDRIRYRTGTSSGSPTLDVRLETVTSGRPSGTLWASGTNAISATLGSNANAETTLTNPATVNQGDLIALVFAWVNGSTAIVNCSAGGLVNQQFPGFYADNAGAGYVVSAARVPNFALRYDDGTYATGLGCYWATAATTSATFSSGEQGIRFRLPYKARVGGLWHTYDPDTALTFNLYADATAPGGTTLATRTQQANEFEAAAAQIAVCEFTNSVVLNANTWYRLVCSVAAASSNFRYIDVPAAAELAATPAGADFYQTVSSGSSWVDTTTRQPQMGLLIDGLDDGVGGVSGGCPLVGNGGLVY